MTWTQVTEEDGSITAKLEAGQKNNTEVMASVTAPAKVEIIKKPITKKAKLSSSSHDPVNHPKHYTEHPSGIECIQITEHMGFNLGNAMKYVWRADLKHNAVEDLQKAVWYINREIEKRSK